jgi:hypothetical protein
MQQRLGIGRIGIDPWSFYIGPEDERLARHATPGMDAAMAVERDGDALAFRDLNGHDALPGFGRTIDPPGA